ncbi:MAG: carbohydrate ABC transporter permease [Spirochaetales bacterium]
MKVKKGMRRARGDLFFELVMGSFLLVVALVTLFPILFVVAASLSSPQAVIAGQVWIWPVDPTLKAYENILSNPKLSLGFLNSAIYTILGTITSIALTLMMAYPLSKLRLPGRKLLTWMLVFTMLFSGGLIPTYMVVRQLGLLDTWWAVVLTSALSPWNVFIARTYFRSLPDELYESATIDGSGELGQFFRIAIPLSSPIIAVVGLFSAIAYWNSYFTALIYLSDEALFPLQIVLRDILILGNLDLTRVFDFDAMVRRQGLSDLLKYAVIVVASAPLLVLYPLVQKYFVRGLLIGSIKG